MTLLLISIPTRLLICLHPPTSFHQRNLAAGWQGSRLTFRQGHQTLPHLSFLFIPHSLSAPFCDSPIYSLTSVPLCLGLKLGQPVRTTGGLVCGIGLISTGVWRQMLRYLLPPPPSLAPSSSLHLSWCLSRLLPSCSLRRQVCEGCRCQLSFHGRLPTSLHIFCPLSFPCLFPSLILFPPHLPLCTC